MDRGAWQATVHGVAKSWTGLKRLTMHVCKGPGLSAALCKLDISPVGCLTTFGEGYSYP